MGCGTLNPGVTFFEGFLSVILLCWQSALMALHCTLQYYFWIRDVPTLKYSGH